MDLPSREYEERVVDVLRDLVRIDTTNPPGNEVLAARYLADLLAPAGVQTQVVESAPGRGNLIARLRGSGQAKPLMLMGHLDVVAANPAEWTHPPFAADVEDGFVWGRGTTDMKNMVAASAVCMLALTIAGIPLQRDLLLVASADEECGGRMGIGWLAEHRPEILDVACALNEGGGSTLMAHGHLFSTCQTAEKGVCRTVWTAHGRGGHAAYPEAGMASHVLSRAVGRVGDGHLGGRMVGTMSRALRMMAAEISPEVERRVGSHLVQGEIEDALDDLSLDAVNRQRVRALCYDTVAVTGLRAGNPQSINVITPTATAYADGRILPGQTDDGLIGLIQERIGNEVDVQVYENQYSTGLESPADAPIVRVISDVMAERCNGARVIPWMCGGSTDAKHLVPKGVPVYGFVPSLPMPKGTEAAGAHAVDERVWIEGLRFTLRALYDIVHRFCVAG